jgi:glycosyltransferase involved in cell wall biosynthesis
MKKVLFYIENKWAFGSIHYGLCKELYKRGIHCDLLDWSIEYTNDEFDFLIDRYDTILTTPVYVLQLHYKYNVPLEKIVAVAHGQWDVLLAKSTANFDFYPLLKKFGVISNVLYKKCIEWNISVLPTVVETGIHFDFYFSRPPDNLKTVGYGGAKHTYNFAGAEIKRGNLVEAGVEGTGLTLKTHNFYNFLCMPGYYRSIDCLVMSSAEEAGGLPIMEAAAAGRLVLGTKVGYFEEHCDIEGLNRGGIPLPLDGSEFTRHLNETLCMFSKDSTKFKNKCNQIQEYAFHHYDWSRKIDKWVEFLS